MSQQDKMRNGDDQVKKRRKLVVVSAAAAVAAAWLVGCWFFGKLALSPLLAVVGMRMISSRRLSNE